MMIEEFLDYLRYERNRSPKTVIEYEADLMAFERFFQNLDTHLSWESIDSDIIRDWMESMMDKGNNATDTFRRYYNTRHLSFVELTLFIVLQNKGT